MTGYNNSTGSCFILESNCGLLWGKSCVLLTHSFTPTFEDQGWIGGFLWVGLLLIQTYIVLFYRSKMSLSCEPEKWSLHTPSLLVLFSHYSPLHQRGGTFPAMCRACGESRQSPRPGTPPDKVIEVCHSEIKTAPSIQWVPPPGSHYHSRSPCQKAQMDM